MIKKNIIIFALVFCSLLLLPNISADIISINSGGDENIIINPQMHIEGFFFEGERGAICGNGVLENGEECDDGNTVSGDGCDSSCDLEDIPDPDPYCGDGICNNGETVGTCPEDCESGSSGGGGGGSSLGLEVSPREINLNLIANDDPTDFSISTTKVIRVTNYYAEEITIAVGQVNLGGMVFLNETIVTLQAGETKDLSVIFVPPRSSGVFVGKILVGSEAVLVSLNVKPKLLLFDSNIVVLNKDYKVSQGGILNTEITLLPMGDQERLDVTLDYEIKDFNWQVYSEKSETLLLEEEMTIQRDFDLGDIPLGKYIINLDLIYPEGVAPSSAHFEVVTKTNKIFGTILLILIILILIILIILIIVVIKRRRDKEKEKETQNLSTT